jgi:hypothetical protein
MVIYSWGKVWSDASGRTLDHGIAAEKRKLTEQALHYGKIYIARPQFAVRMCLDGGDEI